MRIRHLGRLSAFAAVAVAARSSAAQEAQPAPPVPTTAAPAATPPIPPKAPAAPGSGPSTTGTPHPTPPAFEGATSPSPGTPAARVLTLSAVERSAIEQQPQMRVARAQTGVAEAGADVNLAPLLPQVVANAIYSHQWGNFRSSGTTNGAVATTGGGTNTGSPLSTQFNVYSFGVNAQQLIYDFGQTTGRYRAAESTVEAQRYYEQTTRIGIVSNVRRAYFQARANKERIDVAREQLGTQQKHVVQTKGFVTVGTQPPIALVQQQAAVATAEVQLITAENDYETAKAQLNQAAGMIGGTDYDVTDETLGPLPEEERPLDVLVESAVKARPELATLQKQTEAQQEYIRSAKGGYGPALYATGGASESGAALDALGPNINVGVSLTWPLFQGGLTIAEVRQAEANLDLVESQRQLAELQIRLDVNTAQLAVRAAKATIGAANDALDNAREQLRLAEQRYTTGVGNFVELNDAQLAYTQAAGQVVTAKYQLASARAALLAALGRT